MAALPPAARALPRGSDGDSSSSPAASPDSGGRSPPARGPRRRAAASARQSASEREKLRMRRLARALRTLRLYLPPALAPAGQSLSKAQTLRRAARYIAHLSALLGARAAAPRCCAPGLGCRRAPPPPWDPPFCAPAPGTPPQPHGALVDVVSCLTPPPSCTGPGGPLELDGSPALGTCAWGLLPGGPAAGAPPEPLLMDACPWLPPSHGAAAGPPPGLDEALLLSTPSWPSPPHCAAAGSPPQPDGALPLDAFSWPSPPHCAMAGSPPQPDGALLDTSSWPSPPYCAAARTAPEPPSDPSLDTAGLMVPELTDAGMLSQELPAELLSLLESLLPPLPRA